MSITEKQTLEDGKVGNFGGRYVWVEDGEQKSLDFYWVESNEAVGTKDRAAISLIPTKSWTHEFGPEPWKARHKEGIRRVFVEKKVWERLAEAGEMQEFDYDRYGFVNKLTNTFIGVERPQKAEQKKKSLEDISQKVVNKNMSTSNTTLSTSNTTLSMLKSAGVDAAKLVGANQANEIITSSIKSGLAKFNLKSEFLDSELGTMVMKAAGPILIHYLADTQAETINNMLGQNAAANIKEGCKFATQANMQDTLQPLIAFLIPMLKDLASLGASSIASAAKTGAMEEDHAVDTLLSKEKVAG